MSRKTLQAERRKSCHTQRLTFTQTFDNEIEYIIDSRKAMQVIDHTPNHANVTPKFIEPDEPTCAKFRLIHHFVADKVRGIAAQGRSSAETSSDRRQSLSSVKTKSSTHLALGLKLSLDDIIQGFGSLHALHVDNEEFESCLQHLPAARKFGLPFVRAVLRKSKEIVLYEQISTSALKGTADGDATEYDNRIYDYLTIGKGKIRRRADAEAQTAGILVKSREANTTVRKYADTPAYVSFYEMFDTYQQISAGKHDVDEQEEHLEPDSRYNNTDPLHVIAKNPRFPYAVMVLERMLAGNNYNRSQRCYRNMLLPTKLDTHIEYKYTVNLLYRLIQPVFEATGRLGKRRKAIAAISFCYGNVDLIAVGYGFYSHTARVTAPNGNVCIWSMKNPQNPERSYNFPAPVTAVEFSPFLPNLIAIGLYDGDVQVLNITEPHDPPLAVAQHGSLLSLEPITAIQWFHQPQNDATEIDPFLVLTRDGRVVKFRIIASPYLLGMSQMVLNRIEGKAEGLQTKSLDPKTTEQYESNRHPCSLNLVMHPLVKDLYFILTDEGCVLKCSVNQTHSYIDVLKVHEGAVNCMDYSPWSPRLFLTCGNDWTIRIWLEGIFQPLITLNDRCAPIHCAMWSRTHSTIIISNNRESVDVWDLKRNLLAPVSSTNIDKSFQTVAKLSLCGNPLAIGNERGNILMCSFENMPFQAHMQYEELEKAIYKAVDTSPSLIFELRNIGHFGYENRQMAERKRSRFLK